jgi:hypothetical protein
MPETAWVTELSVDQVLTTYPCHNITTCNASLNSPLHPHLSILASSKYSEQCEHSCQHGPLPLRRQHMGQVPQAQEGQGTKQPGSLPFSIAQALLEGDTWGGEGRREGIQAQAVARGLEAKPH